MRLRSRKAAKLSPRRVGSKGARLKTGQRSYSQSIKQGRKSLTSTACSQQAFRRRKEQIVRDLHNQIDMLTERMNGLMVENETLKEQLLANARRHPGHVQMTGFDECGILAMQRHLLSAANDLDSSDSVQERGGTHRALVMGVMACLRSLTVSVGNGTHRAGNEEVLQWS